MSMFAGFPTGKNPYVPVPEAFFTYILPQIQDSVELKVTLHLFWLLAKKQSQPRCISIHELLQDQVLLRSLKRPGDPRSAQERLLQGLDQAVARGTLLRIYLRMLDEEQMSDDDIAWYFLNTTRNQKIVADLQEGEMGSASQSNGHQPHGYHEQVYEEVIAADHYPESGGYANAGQIQVTVDRPNIFALYEQNIGLLTPMLAEQLKDAADLYPAEWIEAAFRQALLYNKRNWGYIHAILKRWATEGRS